MKCVTFLICALVFNVCYCQEQETPANNTVTTGDLESKKNETSSANENTTLTGYFPNNMGSIKRAMYVFLGVTVIVIVYFGIRTYRYVISPGSHNKPQFHAEGYQVRLSYFCGLIMILN